MDAPRITKIIPSPPKIYIDEIKDIADKQQTFHNKEVPLVLFFDAIEHMPLVIQGVTRFGANIKNIEEAFTSNRPPYVREQNAYLEQLTQEYLHEMKQFIATNKSQTTSADQEEFREYQKKTEQALNHMHKFEKTEKTIWYGKDIFGNHRKPHYIPKEQIHNPHRKLLVTTKKQYIINTMMSVRRIVRKLRISNEDYEPDDAPFNYRYEQLEKLKEFYTLVFSQLSPKEKIHMKNGAQKMAEVTQGTIIQGVPLAIVTSNPSYATILYCASGMEKEFYDLMKESINPKYDSPTIDISIYVRHPHLNEFALKGRIKYTVQKKLIFAPTLTV